MFAHKEKLQITGSIPQFTVKYVGHVTTWTTTGLGCTRTPVQQIWDGSPPERDMPCVTLSLDPTGMELRSMEEKRLESFDIRYVCYCATDSEHHPKIFSWIYKKPGIAAVCHAVICSHAEKAQTLAGCMSQVFHIAYKDWKSKQHNKQPHETVTCSKNHSTQNSTDKDTSDDTNCNEQTVTISNTANKYNSSSGIATDGALDEDLFENSRL